NINNINNINNGNIGNHYYNSNYINTEAILLSKAEREEQAIKRFDILGIPSLLFAFVAMISLHNSFYGISNVFAAIAAVSYIFHIAKVYKKTPGKFIIFNCVICILLSISNFITGNDGIIFFNYCGIIMLIIVNELYIFADVSGANLTSHIILIVITLFNSLGNLTYPVSDLIAKQKNTKIEKNSTTVHIIIGVCISIPMVIIIGSLLASADQIFSESFGFISKLVNPDYLITQLIGLAFLFLFSYFSSYVLTSFFTERSVTAKKGKAIHFEPVIAIIVTSSVSVMYIFFCAIQIYYLFLRNGTLPDNYTYAQYAREGFFQLLAVCVINILIVLICNEFFGYNKVLSAVNLVISGCTFIMIASSAYRMLMYISEYGLTTTRVFVLWFLTLLTFIMIGLIVQICNNSFNLFRYCVITVSACYLILSLGHIDYLIAYYNLNMYGNTLSTAVDTDYSEDHSYDYVDFEYINQLSTDAAPAIAAHSDQMIEFLKNYDNYYSEGMEPDDYTSSDNYGYDIKYCSWAHIHYKESDGYEQNKIGIRNFNVSHYIAQKLFTKYYVE
ncbi:MAG: DUF4173 domain-containing protein, partial [Lachnospiraceae bacterium]|nr:DUF4173 domain-containing protein [Lachnospiraceae bacterium]